MEGTGYNQGEPVTLQLYSILGGGYLRADAAEAYNRMMTSMTRSIDRHAAPVSAFRTYAEQETLFKAYEAGTGNLAARPGFSEHQSGICVDEGRINPDKPDYDEVKDKWLMTNCSYFGWVRNGLNFGEPWHMTYRP